MVHIWLSSMSGILYGMWRFHLHASEHTVPLYSWWKQWKHNILWKWMQLPISCHKYITNSMKLYIVVANGMPKKCPKFDYPRLDSMDTVGQTNTKVGIFFHFVIQMTRVFIKHSGFPLWVLCFKTYKKCSYTISNTIPNATPEGTKPVNWTYYEPTND